MISILDKYQIHILFSIIRLLPFIIKGKWKATRHHKSKYSLLPSPYVCFKFWSCEICFVSDKIKNSITIHQEQQSMY